MHNKDYPTIGAVTLGQHSISDGLGRTSNQIQKHATVGIFNQTDKCYILTVAS